jgi:hypothetical protein
LTIYVILDFTPYEKNVSFQFLIFVNNTYFTHIFSLFLQYLKLIYISSPPAVTSNEFLFIQPEVSLMNLKKSGIRWGQPYRSPTLSTDTPFPEAERLVTTANVTSKTTNSNSVLPSTASNDIQQHVNSANSDCHSDSDSCAPEVMVPDTRLLSSMQNENWEKMGRAIHLLVWRSSNRIAIILYQGYAHSNKFL